MLYLVKGHLYVASTLLEHDSIRKYCYGYRLIVQHVNVGMELSRMPKELFKCQHCTLASVGGFTTSEVVGCFILLKGRYNENNRVNLETRAIII